MKTATSLVPWLLVFSTTLLRADHNWPQFRGPEGNGHAAQATGLATVWSESENITWKTPIHGRGWSSPVIWENQVWLTTATEDGRKLFAMCVDLDAGHVIHDLHLFDVANPDEIHVTNSYASPTPVLEPGRIYVHFGTYGTACLDTGTGKILWQRRDLPCNHWRGPGSSPILFEDLLIVNLDGFDLQYVVALDKNTGETRWKTDRNIDFQTDDGDLKKAFCTPSIISVEGQLQLISPAAMATIAYDPRTGRELWRLRYANHSATARPLFGHGLLFINSGFSKAELIALRPGTDGDVTDTHVAWRTDRSIGSKPSHLLVEDLLYVVHDQGTASCLDARTGQAVWQKRLGGNFSASPVFADGKLYFPNEEGVTTVVRPGRTCDILATNRLDDGCMASPAIADSALLLRTRTDLYRIGTRD
ncbi:MAG: outer membrane protein assembly factor BamB family protein [Pirellulaceae bacterium]